MVMYQNVMGQRTFSNCGFTASSGKFFPTSIVSTVTKVCFEQPSDMRRTATKNTMDQMIWNHTSVCTCPLTARPIHDLHFHLQRLRHRPPAQEPNLCGCPTGKAELHTGKYHSVDRAITGPVHQNGSLEANVASFQPYSVSPIIACVAGGMAVTEKDR
jgi:hypothetical protein